MTQNQTQPRTCVRNNVAALLAALLTLSVVQAEDSPGIRGTWDQWRGPTRDCRVPAETTVAWPESLDESRLTEQFRVPLSEGYSGPIVSESHVFVTETRDAATEVVRAVNRSTGETDWTTSWEGSVTVPFFAAANGSWIRSTPALDSEGRLYVAGMEDVLVCLNAADGVELWRVDFRERYGTDHESFGFVCSPIVDESGVYVQCAAGLVKTDPATGAEIWRSLKEEGGMMGGAFSSPVFAEIEGYRQLVVQTRKALCGVRPDNGNVLWSVDVPSFRGMNILTPTVIDNRVFTSSYGNGSFLFEVTNSDQAWNVNLLWQTKTEAYMSSPVIIDGRICLHLRNQRCVLINPNDGETLWTTQPFGKYWSIATQGNRMLVLDERGELILADVSAKEFGKLSSRRLGDSSAWAHVAVAGNQVFVRELDGLTVFQWQDQ